MKSVGESNLHIILKWLFVKNQKRVPNKLFNIKFHRQLKYPKLEAKYFERNLKMLFFKIEAWMIIEISQINFHHNYHHNVILHFNYAILNFILNRALRNHAPPLHTIDLLF